MTQPHTTGPNDPIAVADYRQQSRDFLVKSRQYLAAGDLHQASEKGWDAASWMAKAVATAQGWQYERHEQFNVVLNNVRALTGDDRLPGLRSIAGTLHGNFYTRKRFLDSESISVDLERIVELLDLLEPLTGAGA
jgi:hypothetical protein